MKRILVLVDLSEATPQVSRRTRSAKIRRKRPALRQVAAAERRLGTRAVALVVRGSPVRKSLDEIDRRPPDLVVVRSRRRGRLARLAPGQVGAAIAARSRRPVLVVPILAPPGPPPWIPFARGAQTPT